MDRFRILSPEEVERLRSRRRADLTDYRELLKDLGPDQWAELRLTETETPWTTKRRIQDVAKERGLRARFRASEKGVLRFRLERPRAPAEPSE